MDPRLTTSDLRVHLEDFRLISDVRSALDAFAKESDRRLLETKSMSEMWQWQAHDGTFIDYEPGTQAQIKDHIIQFPKEFVEAAMSVLKQFVPSRACRQGSHGKLPQQ